MWLLDLDIQAVAVWMLLEVFCEQSAPEFREIKMKKGFETFATNLWSFGEKIGCTNIFECVQNSSDKTVSLCNSHEEFENP